MKKISRLSPFIMILLVASLIVYSVLQNIPFIWISLVISLVFLFCSIVFRKMRLLMYLSYIFALAQVLYITLLSYYANGMATNIVMLPLLIYSILGIVLFWFSVSKRFSD